MSRNTSKITMKKQIMNLCLMVAMAASGTVAQNVVNSKVIPVDSGYLKVDGGKLYYEAAGKGASIVYCMMAWFLVKSGMNNSWCLQNHTGWCATTGAGSENQRPSSSYSHVEDLYQVFAGLKLERAIVFGMSSGGGLAIDFTLKYPGKVRGLVLVGAVVGGLGYTSHMINRGGHLKSPRLIVW